MLFVSREVVCWSCRERDAASTGVAASTVVVVNIVSKSRRNAATSSEVFSRGDTPLRTVQVTYDHSILEVKLAEK